MPTEMRVEQHVLKSSCPQYSLIRNFCHQSKNLYNHANYLNRKALIENGMRLSYRTLDKQLKQDADYMDYRAMPTAQSAQQTLKMLDMAWKSFFAVIKDWKAHKEKYQGRPKLPGYLKKDGCYVLILTNQNCRVKGDILVFPKVFDGFSVKPKFLSNPQFESFRQARFLPRRNRMILELVYQIRVPDEQAYNGRCIALDLGVNNLAAVVNNWGERQFLLNGRPLKAINRFANKEIAKRQSLLEQTNGCHTSGRVSRLLEKRGYKLKDYMHKASRYLINYCVEHRVTRIIIGKNDGWKQKTDIGKQNNQNFVQIPFEHFIQMVSYKAKEQGIAVILTEESYTSGTSFLDNEEPTRQFYNYARRVHRGLFRADNGCFINADVNAAFQIMKKVVPIQWDRGCVLHPVLVTMQ